MAPTRVLVAEDDDAFRALVVATLRAEGYEVTEARNGGELFDIIASCMVGLPRGHAREEAWPSCVVMPDLIVSDIRMPAYSGLDVVTRLRQADRVTPVILMTAFGDPEVHAAALRAGADLVFDKPFDMDTLSRAARKLAPRHAPG